MTPHKYEQFFDLLCEIVQEQGTWQAKRDRVKSESAEHSTEAAVALLEFVGWFEEEK